MNDSVEPLDEQDSADEYQVPDVSQHSLLELLLTGDPVIVGSVRRLVTERKYRADIVLGWNARLDAFGPRTSRTPGDAPDDRQ